MSGRSTADLVADLRNWRTLVVTKVGTDEGSGHAALQDEAADRLAELDAEVKRLDGYLTSCDAAREEVIAQRDALLAALPDCPTCGGKGTIWDTTTSIEDFARCPDCPDTPGKMPLARMAAIVRAVFDPAYPRDGTAAYLRGIR